MSGDRAYLDWNASAPLRPGARTAMLAAMELVGNPSSVHGEGRHARGILEEARADVARLVGARPSEVIFTSGGTEANNIAVAAGWRRIVTTAVEHESVLAAARRHARDVSVVPVDRNGIVGREALASALSDVEDVSSTLLSVQMANNETGVIQPVDEITSVAKACGISVHSDAVQAAGRLPVDFGSLGLDMLSISAHKLGGPKGVGALVVRDGIGVRSLVAGGGQEGRRRAGTENLVGIAGFGGAARAARDEHRLCGRLSSLRKAIEEVILSTVPGSMIVGGDVPRLPNTVCFTWPGKAADTLLIRLDLGGVAVSSGAACSSGKVGPSHVLAAMGLGVAESRSAIRVSFGATTAKHEIERFLSVLCTITGATARRPFDLIDRPDAFGDRLETTMGVA
ncbi:MAG: cysteine desulfurase family protein [Hyphomicrobiaceae bacterium]